MKSIKKIGLLFLFVAMVALLPLSAQAATLYGISWNGHNAADPGESSLYRIDPETGVGTFICDLGYSVKSIAVDPVTGLIYGATASWSGDFDGLLLIDPATGSSAEVGEFGRSFNSIGGLTFNSAGQLYGWHETRRDHLVGIDTTDGSAMALGNYSLITGSPVMAFDNTDTLILVNGLKMYDINESNGYPRSIGALSNYPGSGSADFDPATGFLWTPVDDGYSPDSWIRVTDIAGKNFVDIDTDIQYLHALAFDDVESDSDGDGILDPEDFCPETPPGVSVDIEGCSGEQSVDMECPCDGAWKNHGEYVRCVAHVSEDQLAAGLITLEEKDAIVSQRAKGKCGKKK